MSWTSVSLALLSVTLSAFAQIAFKLGVVGKADRSDQIMGTLSLLLTPGVLLGLALYGIGTLAWLNVLGRVDLSQAYPFVGLGFAVTTFAGWWLFGDTLSTQRIAGIALVVVGIVLISRT
jgi:multidrug transporter EmrE-like cation transporter